VLGGLLAGVALCAASAPQQVTEGGQDARPTPPVFATVQK